MRRRSTTPGAKPKRPKVRLAPSYTPHECVLLTVDTAEHSGWSIRVRGELVNWGEVDMLDPSKSSDRSGEGSGWDADRVCLHALEECAFGNDLPVVLVYELPFGGTRQGQYIGAWKRSFIGAGGAKARMHGVYPSTWRARVTGLAVAERVIARRGDNARAQREIARSPSGAGQDWATIQVGGDAASAICMSVWAMYAGEVAKRLPKPRAPRRLDAEAQSANVCEHGDHPAPAGRRFCSRACAECELAEHDASRGECAGLCGAGEAARRAT